MTESLRTDYGPVHEPTPQEKRECGIRMAESAIRVERWRKKGKERRDHDLVTVLLSHLVIVALLQDHGPVAPSPSCASAPHGWRTRPSVCRTRASPAGWARVRGRRSEERRVGTE